MENKDILDAAQKLSISVSHSSSISAEDAKKIKNLINTKNSDKKILSINKPSFKKNNYIKNEQVSPVNGKPLKDDSNKQPLLIKPLNKPESLKVISNKPKNPNKPIIVNTPQSQANPTNQNINNKPKEISNRIKKLFQIKLLPLSKVPPNRLYN